MSMFAETELAPSQHPTSAYLGVQEVETFVNVFDFVYRKCAVVWLSQLFAAHNLKQTEQFFAVTQIFENVVYFETMLQ